MTPKVLRVGAVQMDSIPGEVEINRRHAAELVERAFHMGAGLVLLPELMPGGYMLTEAIWECAEPANGPTSAWLARLAKSLGIYVGTSFLEVDGEDFFNTFLLANPAGEIAGRVRKSPPASLEAYFYRAGTGSHVIETDLGRIGVGICYENLLYERLDDFCHSSVDLVLQPSAAGRPVPMKPGDVEAFDRLVERVAPRYARALHVPVMLANRTGPIKTPLPGGMGDLQSSFSGRSAIVDSNGVVKAIMGDEEGAIVAEVRQNPNWGRLVKPRRYGKMWSLPMPWYAPYWPLTQAQGELSYKDNPRRAEWAARRKSAFRSGV